MSERSDQTIVPRGPVKTKEPGAAKNRRVDSTLSIRKTKRLESLTKRRLERPVSSTSSSSSASTSSPSDSPFRTSSGDAEEITYDKSQLPGLTRALFHGNEEQAFAALQQFRKFLSLQRPPLDDVVACGVVPRMVELLAGKHSQPAMRLEACQALANIASGSSEDAQAVVDASGIRAFLKIAQTTDGELCEEAVRGLANIAGDSAELRDLTIDSGVIDLLLNHINRDRSPKLLMNCGWLISNLCRNKPAATLAVIRPTLPMLAWMIVYPDENVVQEAMWALSYFTRSRRSKKHSKASIDAVIECGMVPPVVQLMSCPYRQIHTAALNIVGNIATGNHRQTETVLEAGCLLPLSKFLRSTTVALRKETAWTISNITAGTKDQIWKVIKSGLMETLASLVHCEYTIREEAAYAIVNAVQGGSTEQVIALADTPQLIESLCRMLTRNSPRIARKCIAALHKIVIVGLDTYGSPHNPFARQMQRFGAVEMLWSLLDLANPKIERRASRLVKLLDIDSDNRDTATLAPAEKDGAFVFGAADDLDF